MKTGYFFIIKNNTSRGKDLSQLLHAGEKVYKNEGEVNKKIVYKIKLEEVEELLLFFKKNKTKFYEVIDAGRTQVLPNTRTVIAVVLEEEVPFFSRYKLY